MRHNWQVWALLLLVLVGPVVAAPTSYCNARFRYCLRYPPEVFAALGESGNGDGQRFLSRDRQAEMAVWGFENYLDTTLKIEYREAGRSDTLTGRVVTSKLLGDDYFVVRGFEGRHAFYRKTIFRDGVFKNFVLRFPNALKDRYAPLAEQLLKDFTG